MSSVVRLGMPPTRVTWWLIAAVCGVYGLWAVGSGVAEAAFVLGIASEEKQRAVPLVFAIHAFTGGVALLAGPLQFHPGVRRLRSVHRGIGLTYVVAAWFASVAGGIDAASFHVTPVAKLVFILTAAAWFAFTTAALVHARARRLQAHREWMVRSFSLTCFAVTFSLWVPIFARTPLAPSIAYPFALILSGVLNLAVAEGWIQYARAVRTGRQRRDSLQQLSDQEPTRARNNLASI
jgi:hypothetical protein